MTHAVLKYSGFIISRPLRIEYPGAWDHVMNREPRNVADYLTRRLRHDSLRKIAAEFKMKKYSTVSSIVKRVKVRTGTDRKFKKRIDEICALIKSQEQT